MTTTGTAGLRHRRGPAVHVRIPCVHPRGARARAAQVRGTRQSCGARRCQRARRRLSADKGAHKAADKYEDEGKAGELNPKAYMDVLLVVHEKNAATVTRSLKGEAGFAATLDKACRDFVNQNAECGHGCILFVSPTIRRLIGAPLHRHECGAVAGTAGKTCVCC
jgi:hypothetical protein